MNNHHAYHNHHNYPSNRTTSSIDIENLVSPHTISTTATHKLDQIKHKQLQQQLPANNNINNVQYHNKSNQTTQQHLRPCIHKATTRCQLDDSKHCCACLDQRPHEPFYTKYVDGVGVISDASRWDYYCPSCKVFWDAAISRSGVAPQDTKIPYYPTHTRKAVSPQNSGLSAMMANATVNSSPVAAATTAPTSPQQQKQQKLQSPLSTSAGGKPVLSKLTIPQSTRPMPVLTVHFKQGQQDQQAPKQQLQQQQGRPAIVTSNQQEQLKFVNPFRPIQQQPQLQQQQQRTMIRPIVHQSLQPSLFRSNAVLRSAHNDYPSPPASSTLSREHSDYYSNDDLDNISDCSSEDSVDIVGEDIARETETFQTQRNHTRLATRATVRGDFKAAEAHFTTAYTIACSSRWKASARSDRVALAIKIAEAQSSQGLHSKAFQTLNLASEVAEQMSSNEYYYKVQLAMSEVGFKVAEAAEKRRKRVMKSVEEEYGRDSDLFREACKIGQYAAFAAMAGKARDGMDGYNNDGEPARKRCMVKKGNSDLGTHNNVNIKKEPIEIDEDDEKMNDWENINPAGKAMAVLEAMA